MPTSILKEHAISTGRHILVSDTFMHHFRSLPYHLFLGPLSTFESQLLLGWLTLNGLRPTSYEWNLRVFCSLFSLLSSHSSAFLSMLRLKLQKERLKYNLEERERTSLNLLEHTFLPGEIETSI